MNDIELIGFAKYVVSEIKPNRGDSESAEDCVQQAYVAGLAELRKAEAKNRRTKRRILRACMQRAVFNLLLKKRPMPCELSDEREAQLPPSEPDGADFLHTHMASLSPKERRTVDLHLAGNSASVIAAAEGITTHAVWKRIREAIAHLRGLSLEMSCP
jgi:DNA-directed RNA polymerase specialized sigma24 family protein